MKKIKKFLKRDECLNCEYGTICDENPFFCPKPQRLRKNLEKRVEKK